MSNKSFGWYTKQTRSSGKNGWNKDRDLETTKGIHFFQHGYHPGVRSEGIIIFGIKNAVVTRICFDSTTLIPSISPFFPFKVTPISFVPCCSIMQKISNRIYQVKLFIAFDPLCICRHSEHLHCTIDVFKYPGKYFDLCKKECSIFA